MKTWTVRSVVDIVIASNSTPVLVLSVVRGFARIVGGLRRTT